MYIDREIEQADYARKKEELLHEKAGIRERIRPLRSVGRPHLAGQGHGHSVFLQTLRPAPAGKGGRDDMTTFTVPFGPGEGLMLRPQ